MKGLLTLCVVVLGFAALGLGAGCYARQTAEECPDHDGACGRGPPTTAQEASPAASGEGTLLSDVGEMEECGSPPGDGGSSEPQAQCAPPSNPTPVPDVVGMGVEEACRTLLREEFLAYVYGKRDVEGVRPGRVAAQKPAAGKVLQPQGVFLFVSKPFPDVLPLGAMRPARGRPAALSRWNFGEPPTQKFRERIFHALG